MDDTIKMNSTGQARTSASTLSSDAAFYTQLVADLRNAQTQISTNWEGDSTDINDIVTRINSVCNEFETKIIPSLEKLANGVTTLADDVDAVSNNTVENGGATASGSASGESATETKSEKKGFWKTIGDDFCDDWDYSDTNGLISAIGNTATGLLNTIGSGFNTVVRCAGGLVDFILR